MLDSLQDSRLTHKQADAIFKFKFSSLMSQDFMCFPADFNLEHLYIRDFNEGQYSLHIFWLISD